MQIRHVSEHLTFLKRIMDDESAESSGRADKQGRVGRETYVEFGRRVPLERVSTAVKKRRFARCSWLATSAGEPASKS